MFMELTKNQGGVWCASMNAFLMSRLDSAVRTYSFYCVETPADLVLDAMCVNSLASVMEREIELFVGSGSFTCPGYYSFICRNFRYYASRLDYTVHYSTRIVNLPTAVFQKIMLAFVMGSHPRLGSNSVIRILNDELVAHIFTYGVF